MGLYVLQVCHCNTFWPSIGLCVICRSLLYIQQNLCIMFRSLLSLYCTATQNHSRWVLALAWTPNTTLLRHVMQNIPTGWYILALPNAKICVTPNANPRRQSVEYRWHWVFWRWPCIFHVYFMYISCCLYIIFWVVYFMYISCIFHVGCTSFSGLATRELANANPVSSGIWALVLHISHHL